MEEHYRSQWDGHTEEEGEGALALVNLTDGAAGKEPTTLSRSSEPMRVDLRDLIKPKKVVTSKLNTKKQKVKMQKQNRFEILSCLLEDNQVNEEEPKDWRPRRPSWTRPKWRSCAVCLKLTTHFAT